MSEFHVVCVRIGPIEKHPNADSLSITNIHNGYPVIFRTGDYHEGDLACYIPVDAEVPLCNPEFKFLDAGKGRDKERIRAKRLRGVFSMGLLVPAPSFAKEGDDLQEWFGITKYETESEQLDAIVRDNVKRRGLYGNVQWYISRAINALLVWFGLRKPPGPKLSYFDIDGIRKRSNDFIVGEDVILTEKLDGSLGKFIHTGKHFYIGSRNKWRNDSYWAECALKYDLEFKLKQFPGHVLYGEIIGPTQKRMPYRDGALEFYAFDCYILHEKRWMDYDELCAFCELDLNMQTVPILWRGPWPEDWKSELAPLAEGKSRILGTKHILEGWVAKTTLERDSNHGRVILKLHGENFLLLKDGK
jgi:hypothetical protein